MINKNYAMKELNKIKEFDFIKHLINLDLEIYVVGGIVRDTIMNKDSKDIDLVVRLVELDDLIDILNKYGKVTLCGESFAVVKFEPYNIELSEPIDIALPRADFLRDFKEGHHGIEVVSDKNMNIVDDLKRRDFTINSIAYNLITEEIIDPFGGIEDIQNKIIKATSIESFSDDPLRMLRGIQFASRFNFTIDDNTWNMIKENSENIKYISKERFLIELDKMFYKSNNPKYGIELLDKSDLYYNIFSKNYLNKNYKIFSIFDFYYDICRDENIYRNALKGNDKVFKGVKAIRYVLENKINRRVIFDAIKISDTILESKLIDSDIILEEFKSGKYPKSLKELNINGNDLKKLGYKDIEIGKKLNELVDSILEDKNVNNFINLNK